MLHLDELLLQILDRRLLFWKVLGLDIEGSAQPFVLLMQLSIRNILVKLLNQFLKVPKNDTLYVQKWPQEKRLATPFGVATPGLGTTALETGRLGQRPHRGQPSRPMDETWRGVLWLMHSMADAWRRSLE